MIDIEKYVHNSPSRLITVVGQAGSGKTSLCQRLSCEVPDLSMIDGDHYFYGDSSYRKALLEAKAKNYAAFIDCCNMEAWWDFYRIETDLQNIKTKTVFNCAIINDAIAKLSDEIIYLYTPDELRFRRIVERDSHKRSFEELIARYLITQYAERINHNYIFQNYSDKITCIDQTYKFINLHESVFKGKNFIPFPI